MTTLPLTASQKIGADLLAGQIQQAQRALNEFLLLSLEELGGSRTEPWIYNDRTKEWQRNNADGNANDGTTAPDRKGVAG